MEKAQQYKGYYIGCTSDGEIARVDQFNDAGVRKLSRSYPDGGWFTHTAMPENDTKSEVIRVFKLFGVEFIPSEKEGGDLEAEIVKKIEGMSLECKNRSRS